MFNESIKNSQSEGPRIKIKVLLLLVLLGALIPILWVFLKNIFGQYLETSAPVIQILEAPRGLGITPVSLKIGLVDVGSGLDEIVIRTRQKKSSKEVLRKSLDGQTAAKVNLDFPAEQDKFSEGLLEIDLMVFDRSIWSNTAEQTINLKVDYRRPKIEVLSTQHNARQGGSQLVFFRAFDEFLAVTGVKVDSGGAKNETYFGFPARGLDKAINDNAIFMAIYAVNQHFDPGKTSLKIFAEDEVGNGSSTSFYNKIQPRDGRRLDITLSEEFLRAQSSSLYEANQSKLEGSEDSKEILNALIGDSLLVQQFKILNQNLRELNENELVALLKGPRYESYWREPFLMPVGKIQYAFADRLNYRYAGQGIGQWQADGYEFSYATKDTPVYAANDGIVIFSENIGVYGRVLGIDHGLGLVSVYGHLDQSSVNKGDAVKRGQAIGYVGETGLARGPSLYFEIRVHGTPVNPVEWWDPTWFYSHVQTKIDDLKKTLGIPVLRQL